MPPYAPSTGPYLAPNTLTPANQYILDQIIANNYKTQDYVVTYKDANNNTVVAGNVVGMYTYQGQIAGVQLSQNAPVDPQGKKRLHHQLGELRLRGRDDRGAVVLRGRSTTPSV